MPSHPPEEWGFLFWTSDQVEVIRAWFAAHGFTLLNKNVRRRDILTYQGKTGTLAELARHFNIPYTMAYYRREAGKTLEEVFAKPTFEKT